MIFHREKIETKWDKRILLIMLADILYGVYAMNTASQLNNIASIILLVVLITLPPDKDIYVYAALIPFYTFVPQGSLIRLFFFFIISLIKIFWKNGTEVERRYALCFFVWFGLEIVLDLFYAPGFDFTIILLMLYFVAYMIKCRNIDWEMGNNLMLIMIVSFSVVIIATALSSETSLTYYLQTINAQARFGEDARSLGGAMDLPIYCSVALAVILCTFISKRHVGFFQKILYISLMCLCIVFGSLTVSRSFILAIVIIVIWTYISLIKDNKHRNKIIPITLLALIVAFVLVWNSKEAILNILNKYSQRDFFASSRSNIYSDCFDYLFTHPLNLFFGTGAFGYHYYGIVNNLSFRMFAHNLILDAIMSWGIIGTIAMFSMLCSYYSALKREYGKPEMICFLPLVAWGAIMMTGGTFNYVEPYLYLLILIKMTFSFKLLGDKNNG